jgi:hypothetical protein
MGIKRAMYWEGLTSHVADTLACSYATAGYLTVVEEM